MSSTPPPKRFKSDPSKTPWRFAIDTAHDQPGLARVFSQLNMPVPDGAMAGAAEDEDEAKDLSVDRRLEPHRITLELAVRLYEVDESTCSNAVDLMASGVLPAIFNTSQNSRHGEYKKIIIENPWLVRQLFDACQSRAYQKIRRLGMCSSQIVRSPGLI